jgi:sugar phosphate isomerase/epimerase
MDGPPSDYMRPAIVHFMLYPELISGTGPIAETLLKIITDPFFRAVEIGPVLDPSVLSSVTSLLRQARVEPVYDGQPWTLVPGLDLEAEDQAAREQALTAMRRAIDQAAAVGSRTCGVMSGRITKGLDLAKARKRLADSLISLCKYAEPKGITLCIENFDQLPYSKDALIGPTADAAELVRAVRRKAKNFGLLLDLSHLPIMNETPRDAVLAAKGVITRVQLGNCSTDPYSAYYGDVHPYIGAPRTDVGIAQLTEFLAALLEIGFLRRGGEGIAGFEVKPGVSDNADAIQAGCRSALYEAWALV